MFCLKRQHIGKCVQDELEQVDTPCGEETTGAAAVGTICRFYVGRKGVRPIVKDLLLQLPNQVSVQCLCKKRNLRCQCGLYGYC